MDNRESSGSGVCKHMNDTRVVTSHNSITAEERKHLVELLVYSIYPNPSPAAMLDYRRHKLIAFACAVEDDVYEMAGTRIEYYRLLAEKLYCTEAALDELRRERRERQLREHSLQQQR